MLSLESFINSLRGMNLVEELSYDLDPEFEPTSALKSSDARGTTLLFRVNGKELKCVGNVVNTRGKLYKALGVESDQEAYSRLLNALGGRPTPPPEGSFNEFFLEVSWGLSKLPFIRFYRGDGGSYITSSIVIAKTPDVDGYNASIHRLMLVGEDKVAVRVVPRHLYRIISLNREFGRETPVAIVVGVHPLILLAASSPLPYGVFELDIVNSLSSDGKLLICRTPLYNLPVPCDSSVVIEGRVFNEYVNEGPFVDLLDLYDSVRPQPVIHIDRIYRSKAAVDKLFHVILPGGMEHKILMGFPREALIWDSVRRVVPKVYKVRLTDPAGCWLHAVVSIDKNSDGDAKNAIMAAFAAHPSLKHVIVVDPDIDPERPDHVEWALATRFQAGRGLVIIRDARGSSLDPSSEDGITDKLGIDATAPLSRRGRYRRPEY